MDENEEFEDATEEVFNSNVMMSAIKTVDASQHLFYQNKFTESHDLIDDLANESLYHAHGMTALSVLEALMTFKDEDFKKAIACADITLKLSDQLAKESLGAKLRGTFDSGRYKNWSDERVHAILVRAEALVFKTAVSVMSSGTDIFAIANACLSIRESYKTLEQCQKILKLKKWDSEELKYEFENGIKFGLGVYMLYLSILPGKILTILEWIGFKGDKDGGLDLLYQAAESGTCRSIMSIWFSMAYHYIFQFQFGAVGEINGIDIAKTNQHLAFVSKSFPDGVIIRFNQGKRAQIEGDLHKAIQFFTPVEVGWTNFSHFCYWDLYWSHGMSGNFKEAADFAAKLVKESAWSPAIYTWMQAVALIALNDSQASTKAKELLNSVEGLRQKIGGKSIPDEKFAGKKALNYSNGKTKMIFGFLEAAYWFNYLKVGNKNPNIARFWLQHIQARESELDENSEESGVARLLKANIYNQLGRYVEAAAEAQIILKLFPKPKNEPQLCPSALFELGNSFRLQGKSDDALKCFDRARSDYTKYPFEHRLHFRCHTFKQLIQSNKESTF